MNDSGRPDSAKDPDRASLSETPAGKGRSEIPESGSVPARTPQDPLAGVPVEPNPIPLVDHSANPGFLDAPQDSLLGTVLAGRYRIKRMVGEGGMGKVYEAEHIVLEKRVALKVLNPEYATKQDLRDRFLQEARAASRINHEHIVDITDFGTTDTGTVFFAMEFLDGHDLATILSQEGALVWSRAREIAIQVARALAAAHSKGIIHRDLKPENIFLVNREGKPDFVKVVDFGIAKLIGLDESARKLTKTGVIFGTPDYMSPEQATGRPLDQRADIYALGVILYEMVAGKVPFDAPSFMAILTKHMFEAPLPPSAAAPGLEIDPAVDALILRALEKDPDKRFQSMSEFAEAMKTLVLPAAPEDGRTDDTDDLVLLTRPKDPGMQPDRTAPLANLAPFERRTKTGLVVALVLLAIAGAAGGYLVVHLSRGGQSHVSKRADTESARKRLVTDGGRQSPRTVPAAGSLDGGMGRRPRDARGVSSTVHLSVDTSPPRAKIFVDNRFLGFSPIDNIKIPLSSRKTVLSLRKKRYKEMRVEFVPNRDQAFRIVMEQKDRSSGKTSRSARAGRRRATRADGKSRNTKSRRPAEHKPRPKHDGDLILPTW